MTSSWIAVVAGAAVAVGRSQLSVHRCCSLALLDSVVVVVPFVAVEQLGS